MVIRHYLVRAFRVTFGWLTEYFPPWPAVSAGTKDPHVGPAPRPLQRGAANRYLRL